MIILICLDDKNGMMFHNRRQSQDRGLRAYIRQLVGNSKIYMNQYTRKLYREFSQACVCEDFLFRAQAGDYCLVENQELCPVKDRIEKIIVFRWNKVYPADQILDLSLDGWVLENSREFDGSTHRILQETYVRENKDHVQCQNQKV